MVRLKVMGESRGNTPRRRPSATPTLLVKGSEIPLKEGETLIGRGGNVELSILGTLVSRKHARLSCQDGRVTVADLGSRNGVFVNSARIDSPVLLEDGDTLLIGTTELTFFLGAPDENAAPPARVVLDEQGNRVPESEALASTRTALRFEAEDTLDFDREDVTIQGSRPPKPRTSAMVEKPALPTAPPPTPRRGVGASGALPKLRIPTPSSPPSRPLSSAPPLVGPARRNPSGTPPPRISSSSMAAEDPLSTALDVIDRMLARGDADAAARALAGHLAKRVATARQGARLGHPLLEAASGRCLSLLELTGDPRWFDAVLELHAVSNVPMALGLIERIAPFAGAVPAQSLALLAQYQEQVRDLLGEVDVEGLLACERILSLGA